MHLNKWIIASLLTPERPFTLIYVRKIKRPKGPRLEGAIEEFWSLESTFVCRQRAYVMYQQIDLSREYLVSTV